MSGLRYFHPDHLGPAYRETDQDGDVVWSAIYGPYGEHVHFDNNSNMRYGFTGQEQDTTDWYYAGGEFADAGALSEFCETGPLDRVYVEP